jgi:hypothetical protein
MLLGDMLARFSDETVAAEALLGLDDLTLLTRLQERAAARGQTVGAYAAEAVQRYAAQASNEEWLTLMGALGRADDPGQVCMKRAFHHVLGQPD